MTDTEPNKLLKYVSAVKDARDSVRTYHAKTHVEPAVYPTKNEMLKGHPNAFHIREEISDYSANRYNEILRYKPKMAFLAFDTVQDFIDYRDSYPYDKRYFDELFTSDEIYPIFDIEKTINAASLNEPYTVNFCPVVFIKKIKSGFVDVLREAIWKRDFNFITSRADNIEWYQCDKSRVLRDGSVKISFHLGIKNIRLNRAAMTKSARLLNTFLNKEYGKENPLFMDCIDKTIYNNSLKAIGCSTPNKNNLKFPRVEDSFHEFRYFSTGRDVYKGLRKGRLLSVNKKFTEKKEITLISKISNLTFEGDTVKFNNLIKNLLDIVSEDKTNFNEYEKWRNIGFMVGSAKLGDRETIFMHYEEFSKKSASYNGELCRSIFNSANNTLTVGSLILLAKAVNFKRFMELETYKKEKQDRKMFERFIKNICLKTERARAILNQDKDRRLSEASLLEEGYKYIKQNSRYIKPYVMENTNIIKSAKGTGKTFILPDIINKMSFKSILVIHHRQSLGNQLKNDLNRADCDFRYYNEAALKEQAMIDMRDVNYLCIQAESLKKLVNINHVELIICDEFKSLQKQLLSPTMKNLKVVFNKFERLMIHTPYLVAMDADFEYPDIKFIASYRDIKKTQIIDNVYTDFNNNKNVFFTNTTGIMLSKLMTDVKAGLKIVINCVRSLHFVEALLTILETCSPGFRSRCLVITGATKNEAPVKAALENTEGADGFGKYDYVLYTPTIESGVSFKPRVPHFDKFYAFIYPLNDIPQTEQGTARVRELKLNEYNYAIYNTNDSEPTTGADFDRWVIANKIQWRFAVDMIQTRLNTDGAEIEFPISSKYYELYKRCNLRIFQDKKNFLFNFLKYKYQTGFRNFTYLTEEDFTEGEFKAIAELDTILTDKAGDAKTEHRELIRQCADISDQKADKIQDSLDKEKDVSNQDKQELNKYKLINKLTCLDFDIKGEKMVTIKDKGGNDVEVCAFKCMFMYLVNTIPIYKTLKYMIHQNSDIKHGLRAVEEQDKAALSALVLDEIEDANTLNKFIKACKLDIKINKDATFKEIKEAKKNIKDVINKSCFFDVEGTEIKSDIKEALTQFIYKSNISRVINAFNMLRSLGFNDMLDDKEIKGEDIKKRVLDMYKEKKIYAYICNLSSIKGNERIMNGYKGWEKKGESNIYKSFMMVFNNECKQLGATIRGKTKKVKGKTIRVYRLVHTPVWWLLTHNDRLKQSNIMQKYQELGGYDAFKITNATARNKTDLNDNIIFNDDCITTKIDRAGIYAEDSDDDGDDPDL